MVRVKPATLRAPAIFPRMDKRRRGFVLGYQEYPPGGYLDGNRGLDGLGSGAHLRLHRGIEIGPPHQPQAPRTFISNPQAQQSSRAHSKVMDGLRLTSFSWRPMFSSVLTAPVSGWVGLWALICLL